MQPRVLSRAHPSTNPFWGELSKEQQQFLVFAYDVLDPLCELPEAGASWVDVRDVRNAKTEGFDATLTLNADPAYALTEEVKQQRARSNDPSDTKEVSVALEYKGDGKDTQNFVFELVSMLFSKAECNTQAGWGYTSEAGWLAYQFIDTKDIMLVPLPTLRMHVLSNYNKYKAASVYNKTRGGFFTLNLLINAEQLLAELPWVLLVRIDPAAAEIEAKKKRPRFSSNVTVRTLNDALAIMRKYPKGFTPNPNRNKIKDLGIGGVPMTEGWPASPQLWWQDTAQQRRLDRICEQLRAKDICTQSMINLEEKYLPHGIRQHGEALKHIMSLRNQLLLVTER